MLDLLLLLLVVVVVVVVVVCVCYLFDVVLFWLGERGVGGRGWGGGSGGD